MAPWEQEFVLLIAEAHNKVPAELSKEQLLELRTYIGKELTNRTLKDKANETTA